VTRLLSIFALAVCAAFACTDDGATDETAGGLRDGEVCVGKCDFVGEAPVGTGYRIDLDAVNRIWSNGTPVTSAEELFSVRIGLPTGQTIFAATHLFGEPINPIPYHDADGSQVVDASGQAVMQGDREIARFFPPGRVGYAIKHHRPEHRSLDFGALDGASSSALKEDMKLQDTHIGLVVGVRRLLGTEMVDGVITLNNPQNYQGGRFGSPSYPMIFVRPGFPDYVPADLHDAFEDNIRTMILAFNAVSTFPGDYNGGDPLAARTPEQVREHVRQMLLSVAGEGEDREAARAFFGKPENLIYCAELAHVATTAGVLVPLNRQSVVTGGLVDASVFDRFEQLVAEHNAGRSTPFTQMNSNDLAHYVDATLAPDSLQPLPEYAGDLKAEESQKLAFRPLTMVEIVEGFLKTHIPRNDERLGGEALAPLQGAVLQAMKPGLFEAMGMDDQTHDSMLRRHEERVASLQEDLEDPEIDQATREALQHDLQDVHERMAEVKVHLAGVQQRRAMVDGLFGQIVAVVATPHESYDAFRAALAPLLATARQMAGPRDGTGVGLFVPPSAMHLVAQRSCDGDVRCGGLVGLNYVGHGLHMSAVHLQEPPPPVPPVAIVRIAQVVPRPASDWNRDGDPDPRQDELVTITNEGAAAADLTGWTLHDEVRRRFTFDGITLQPGDVHNVYGGPKGGTPPDANSSLAGSLGLNDNGDALYLFDADEVVVDTIFWGPVEPDVAITPTDECDQGAVEEEACGTAGTRSRTCNHTAWSAWGACVEPVVQEDDPCTSPLELSIDTSGSIEVDTTGAQDHHGGVCGGGGGAPERVVKLTATAPVAVVIKALASHDTLLHLRSTCGDANTELACDDDSAGNMQAMLQADLEAGDSWLFVDAYGASTSGPVTVEVTATPR